LGSGPTFCNSYSSSRGLSEATWAMALPRIGVAEPFTSRELSCETQPIATLPVLTSFFAIFYNDSPPSGVVILSKNYNLGSGPTFCNSLRLASGQWMSAFGTKLLRGNR
jgi:hypothetical protein